MKRVYLFSLTLTIFLYYSCKNSSEFYKEFNCKTTNNQETELVKDVKELFSIKLPKKWKINLYQDELQSSIFAADTSKQLSNSTLIDITWVKKHIRFDEKFKLQQELNFLNKKIIRTKFIEKDFINKKSISFLYKGKKNNLLYTLNTIFIKVNKNNFIEAKTTIYGDSLINKRLCNSIALLEQLKFE